MITHFLTDPDIGLVRAVWKRFDYKKGEIHDGHEHDVDHGTVLHSGKVRIEWWNQTKGTKGTSEFTAPDHFTIRADTHHTITALEDSSWYCVFTPSEGYEQDLKDFWNEKQVYG
jgi:quercetin dioxygenase-like cupin family protein